VEFRILGPLEVRDGREHVPLRGPKQRGLLAVLLLNANRLMPLDRLVDELWDDPPSTAPQAVQVYVSKLRKLFAAARSGAPRIRTRTPGYLLEIEPGTLDLHRFESLVEAGRRELDRGDAETAAAQLRDALGLWRGPPLDGFVAEPFAQPARARLEELELAARELRNEADLALGRHAELAVELQRLVAEHPLRERLRGQLMLALYKSGRQAEALQVYQETRALLVDELGLEPGQALQQLERAILLQDPKLEPSVQPSASPLPAAGPPGAVENRALLVVALDQQSLDPLLWLARPLAVAEPLHEVIVIRLVGLEDEDALLSAASELDIVRSDLAAAGVSARAAAFTSVELGDDLARMASDHEIDLLLIDGGQLLGDDLDPLAPMLEQSLCDVALVLHRGEQPLRLDTDHPPVVIFSGSDPDWAALELGAWLARGAGTPLRLVGTAADAERGRRDASRLLATASLVVQKFVGVYAEPRLATAGSEGVLAAARDAGVVMTGVDARDGVRFGPGHLRIAREAVAPTVFVSRGVRPGGLAPDGLTRFTWSLAGENV
jgi:DNA-binding SARP family transcriptional activator